MELNTLNKYEHASQKATNWLSKQLKNNGSYTTEIDDLAIYYKSPYLFYNSGKLEEANRILNYIKHNFFREDGDFITLNSTKSKNSIFQEYWAYINGWIAIAAQKMGRFDIAYPAYEYLQKHYHTELGGFITNKPDIKDNNVVDVLTTSHLGLMSLYFGDIEKAEKSGHLLDRFFVLQTDINSGFYLRMNNEGKLIDNFPEQSKILFLTSAIEPQQAYFMIGYPIAFLGQLYRATGNKNYLNSAKKYLDFTLNCHDSLRSFHFSHKVAWGASIIANITQNIKYADFSTEIANYLLSIQNSEGAWLKNESDFDTFDQTAEIAIWLKNISVELTAIN